MCSDRGQAKDLIQRGVNAMPLSLINKKLKHVQNKIPNFILNDIEFWIGRSISQGELKEYISGYQVRYFVFDLVYACMYHSRWLNNNAFKNILSQYLARSYKLPHNPCEVTVHEFINYFQDFLPEREQLDHFKDPLDFLRHLFVEAMFASDHDSIAELNGLGPQIFEQIRNAANDLQKQNETESETIYFEGDQNYTLQSLIREVSSKLVGYPAYLECYKLFYTLKGTKIRPLDRFDYQEMIALYQSLVKIELQKGQYSEKNLSDEIKSLKDSELLEVLEKEGKYKISLTKLGQNVTALILPHLSEEVNFWAKLEKLPVPWQEILIKQKQDLNREEISKLLAPRSKISPEAIQLLIHKASKIMEPVDLVELVMTNYKDRLSPTLRSSLCQSLSFISDTKLVLPILLDIVQNDPSEKVQDTAISQIIRMGQIRDVSSLMKKIPNLRSWNL